MQTQTQFVAYLQSESGQVMTQSEGRWKFLQEEELLEATTIVFPTDSRIVQGEVYQGSRLGWIRLSPVCAEKQEELLRILRGLRDL